MEIKESFLTQRLPILRLCNGEIEQVGRLQSKALGYIRSNSVCVSGHRERVAPSTSAGGDQLQGIDRDVRESCLAGGEGRQADNNRLTASVLIKVIDGVTHGKVD